MDLWTLLYANSQGADQPAHPHRLISAFDIRSLRSIISELALGKNSIFQLVVVVQVGFTLKTGFLARLCQFYSSVRVNLMAARSTLSIL